MNRSFLKGSTKRKEIFFKISVSSGTTLRDLKEMQSSQRREKKKIFGEIMAIIFLKLIKTINPDLRYFQRRGGENIWRNNGHNFFKVNKNYKSRLKILNKIPKKTT